MTAPLTLQNFDPVPFLRDYWQQRPLLIRNAFANWRNPVEPDELAGLACEADVESRLVIGSAGEWTVEHGPLRARRFAGLDERDWTLLVQAVDHHVPAVAALIEPFRFIPDWRIDDVMVSYAADGGGVGPHFDQYDVFLVQGLGQRRWRIGQMCDDESPLLPHDDLRLLATFDATDEWVLGPGDMLYLPPGIAHDGVAVGTDCMTYSIGFRTPSRSDLVSLWTDDVLAGLTDDDRYADPGLPVQANPGMISSDALTRLHTMVMESLSDRNQFARWFGRHSTQPRYPDMDWSTEKPITPARLKAALAAGSVLERNPASRFACIDTVEGAMTLFVNGQSHDCTGMTAHFATTLCQNRRIIPDAAWLDDAATLRLIAQLHDDGSIGFASGG